MTDEMLEVPKNSLADLVAIVTSYRKLTETFATLMSGRVVGVGVAVAEWTGQHAYRSGGLYGVAGY